MSHQLQNAQEELQRSHATNTQIQNEEKELQARLASETEERERSQQELHQLKKQASYSVINQNLPLKCTLDH
jgi:molecular chaperone GrpE (heat shock protein)